MLIIGCQFCSWYSKEPVSLFGVKCLIKFNLLLSLARFFKSSRYVSKSPDLRGQASLAVSSHKSGDLRTSCCGLKNLASEGRVEFVTSFTQRKIPFFDYLKMMYLMRRNREPNGRKGHFVFKKPAICFQYFLIKRLKHHDGGLAYDS